ncbi:hypothetical protein HPB50_008164 [Hyalomma asiaticum]|uniref:Uncharacterized protein n=1 Tax=Hyalomma asiaticum TaxID=266040 RepID=A0ACB7T6M5_HYAAI|nr:hypothetical protein HPB50_008164 [Hyalomma asiaticum]
MAGGKTFQVIDGERYIFFRDPDKVRQALRYQPRSGDIIQVVYPKCGMQMMQQIIQLIVHDGHCARNFREFSSRAPFLEDCGGNWTGEDSGTRLFRTHIRLGRIAVTRDAKYVYVARNPWDACYSQYVMNQKMPIFPMRERFDEFLDMFLEGFLTNWCYFEHVLSGYSRRNDPNVFFTTYESMMRDRAATALALAKFLGEKHIKSPALAGSALKEEDLGDETFNLVCRPEVGAWRKAFTQEQLRRTVAKIKDCAGNDFVPQLWDNEWREVLQAAS